MSGPISQRVRLSHERVMAASIASRSRSVPSQWWYFLVLLAMLAMILWAGDLMVFWFVQQLPFEWMFAIGPYLPLVIPAILMLTGVVLVGMFYNRIVRRSYLRHLERLNVPLEIDALYEILPEGLRLTTERIEILPKWHAVDTVSRVADGWVASADQLTFLIPSESFAGPTEERHFMAALVAHLSPEARNRSSSAVAFAGDRPSAS